MNLITIILLLIISIGSFFSYTNPHYKNIEGLHREVSEYQSALDKATEATKIKEELISKYNTFSTDDLSNLQKLLPDTVDNIRLLLDINQVASNYGTNISSLKIDSGTTQSSQNSAGGGGKAYGSILISFSISLSYENSLKFLSDLEHNLRVTDVNSFAFSSNDTGDNSYSISLRTYWLK